MSERGAMVEAGVAPDPGSTVMLIRGTLRVEGRVVWRASNQCGLSFDSSVSITDWLAPAANSEQNRVDQDIARIRAGLVSARVDPPIAAKRTVAPTTEPLIADNLALVVRLLADLEEELIRDPSTVDKHGAKLQNIDLATQVLDVLSAVLTSVDEKREAALGRLDHLQVSCQQALAPH